MLENNLLNIGLKFELEQSEKINSDDITDLRFNIEELHGEKVFIRQIIIPSTIQVLFLLLKFIIV